MPFQVGYMDALGIVTIKNSGKLSFNDWVHKLTKVAGLAREKHTTLFLSDCTDIPIDMKFIELLDFPDLYAKTGFIKSDKIAIVVKEADYIKHDSIFYETVCNHRGWMVKMFVDRELALAWLLEEK
jgi:hypothetical protein